MSGSRDYCHADQIETVTVPHFGPAEWYNATSVYHKKHDDPREKKSPQTTQQQRQFYNCPRSG